MKDILYSVGKMNVNELFSNIEQIKSSWRFQPKGQQRDKAFIMANAIINENNINGIKRGLNQIKLLNAYDGTVVRLFKIANNVPKHLFLKLYNLIIEVGSEIFDEKEMLENVFVNSRRYREIKKGNFISKINLEKWEDALFYGSKVNILYKIGQIKLLYPNFKGRAEPKLLRLIATSKSGGLTPQNAKGYIYALTGTRYNIHRINNIYNKLQ